MRVCGGGRNNESLSPFLIQAFVCRLSRSSNLSTSIAVTQYMQQEQKEVIIRGL